MRTLSATLTRRARVRLGATAAVYREPDGSWTLERPDLPPLGLGDSEHEARDALALLHQAEHPRFRGET